jgi:hypothetical protein
VPFRKVVEMDAKIGSEAIEQIRSRVWKFCGREVVQKKMNGLVLVGGGWAG